jgi:hypothetical protein
MGTIEPLDHYHENMYFTEVDQTKFMMTNELSASHFQKQSLFTGIYPTSDGGIRSDP